MNLRTIAIVFSVAMTVSLSALYAGYVWIDRTPGELLRYAERRLIGHPKLEALFVPLIHRARHRVERRVTGLEPPANWRSARPAPLPSVIYDSAGRPETRAAGFLPAPERLARQVSDVVSLIDAVGSARPGDVIEIMPGQYRVKGGSLATRTGGSAAAPIVVRARSLGSVVLEFELAEGFHVTHPFWIFENLEIRGACSEDSNCEHAFHIAGPARSTVIRNNRIRDFNAHIKVNGANEAFPDFGLLQSNMIFNTRPRRTDNPVTLVDIVGASEWRVVNNFIADFVKVGGDQTSYGVFMKGAGSGGRIEGNMVICTLALQGRPGLRVGVSFGGGGTGAPFCRDRRCEYEHSEGLAANNIVAHCNDFGIDVNRSKGITIAHNTLVNTAGVDIRQYPASAVVSNNLLEGRIRQRNGGWVVEANNWIGSSASLFEDPDHLNFRWTRDPPTVPAVAAATHDICGVKRERATPPGALSGTVSCLHGGPDLSQ